LNLVQGAKKSIWKEKTPALKASQMILSSKRKVGKWQIEKRRKGGGKSKPV
jgi:hypothetical protein